MHKTMLKINGTPKPRNPKTPITYFLAASVHVYTCMQWKWCFIFLLTWQ